MTRIFSVSVIPAISIAAVAYFGYYAIWGERGMMALSDVQAQLGVQKERLAQDRDAHARLEHRITLMRSGDPDLIEEESRGQLMIGGANQVAVTRDTH